MFDYGTPETFQRSSFVYFLHFREDGGEGSAYGTCSENLNSETAIVMFINFDTFNNSVFWKETEDKTINSQVYIPQEDRTVLHQYIFFFFFSNKLINLPDKSFAIPKTKKPKNQDSKQRRAFIT